MNASARLSARRVRPSTVAFKTAIVLIIAATLGGLLLGVVLGRGNQPAPPPFKAPAIVRDGLRVQLPNGWARGDAAAVPGFSHPLGLLSDEGLRASVERLPATSATLLPGAFLKTRTDPPGRPDVVQLTGGRPAWRYRFAEGQGSMTVIYSAPTTGGVATVACTGPLNSRILRRDCEALAVSVAVPDSRPLAPAASAAFYSRVPNAVHDLRAARTQGLAQLDAARTARGQAAAATRLAKAHRAAGAILGPLTRPRDGAPTATVAALTATASAYDALASAAQARLPQPYAKAARNVTGSEAHLLRAMTGVETAADAATQAASTQEREPTGAADPATVAAAAAAKAFATETPAAQAGRGAGPLLLILGLIGMFALFLAVRGTRRDRR